MSWINRSHIIIVAAIILIFANEFTLSFFDPQLPFDQKAIKNLRILDIAIILLILTLIFPYMKIISYVSSVTKETLSYILPVFIAVVALDIIMKLLGYGYPTHYNQENLERVPHPHDTFRGQPNVRDHNEFGFRGTFKSSENNYNIAIFGGSTTYNGTPPIIEIMSEKLRKKGMNVGVYNFGSVSSNHSQHVHRLIEFSDRYSFDLVIFYGGGNETFQYANYDPRPGYPYNFFFRNELAPWKQALLRFSSIAGEIDMYTGGTISGLENLRAGKLDDTWQSAVVKNYWRDLSLANSITRHIINPNICNVSRFLSVLQPGNPQTELEKALWEALLNSQSTNFPTWKHIDLTHVSDSIEFTDIIHVTQSSRAIIAANLVEIIEDDLKDCEGDFK